LDSVRVTPLRWALTVGLLVSLILTSALLWKMISGGDRAAVQPAAGGNVVADFTLPDVAGQPVAFREFVAGRPAVISFGTTSCPYCVLQLKAFRELRDKLGDKIALLEINIGEPSDRVAAHVQRLQSPIKTLVDLDGSIYTRFGQTNAVPVTVVVDPAGRILEIGNYIPASRISELLRLASTPARAG
jgi:peroxiredoxin